MKPIMNKILFAMMAGILLLAGCLPAYVSQSRWADRHPGYHREHMRLKRANEGDYVEHETKQQKVYYVKKRRRVMGHKKLYRPYTCPCMS